MTCASDSADYRTVRRVIAVALILLGPPALVAYGWGIEQLIRSLGGS